MFWTYVLYSERYNKFYIGFTSDLEKRLIAHNHPKNKGYTKRFKPWQMIYLKAFDSKAEAMDHEKFLKSIKNKKYLRSYLTKE